MSNALTTSLLEDIRDLEGCRQEWDDLLAASANDRPMLSPLWLLAWWRVFGSRDGRRLKVWAFRAGGRLVGLVPMLRRRHRHFGVLPMRRLELLGSGEQEKDEIMSEYLSPIVAPGYEDAVADAWVRQLASDAHDWQEIKLSALAATAPAVAALEPALDRQGWSWQRMTETHCPFIKLPSRWEDYLASLTRNHRYLAKAALRDFAAWAGETWQFERATTPADLPRGRDILLQLHRQRWEKAGKPGAFSSPQFLRFHDDVMPRLLEQNALDLCWVSVRGRPIAVGYNIVWRNRVYVYQNGRTFDVPNRIRPGVVLHLETIKRAIEQGREEYDFLGGPSLYKTQLATATRPLVGIRVVRPCLAEAARMLLSRGATLLREAHRRQEEARVSKGSPASPEGSAAD